MIVKKSDILFLLIGSNPFPNYLAFLARVKERGKVYLIHTIETEKIADRLKLIIDKKDYQTDKIIVHRAEPEKIILETKQRLEKILQIIPNQTSIELHYTGGTKAMTVHVHRAFEAVEAKYKQIKFNYSYLDADEECIYYDRNNKDKIIDLIDASKDFTIEVLTKLHDIELNKDINKQEISKEARDIYTKMLDICTSVKNLEGSIQCEYLSRLLQLCNKAISGVKKKHSIEKQNEKIIKNINKLEEKESIKLEIEVKDEKVNLLSEYDSILDICNETTHKYSLLNKIKGFWMEDYILDCIHRIDKKYPNMIMDFANSIERKKEKTKDIDSFEVDISVLMKYKFYAISATMQEKKNDCKFKLFEIKQRAIQLAGDEAGVCLVCLYKNSIELENEIKNSWGNKDIKNLKVIGLDRIKNLEEHLTNWLMMGRQ